MVFSLKDLYNDSKEEKSKISIEFPLSFVKYNEKMGGVDLHNQHCNNVIPCIRSKKWTWCFFVRIIQATIGNSSVLHNNINPENKKGTLNIAMEVVDYFLDQFTKTRKNPKRKNVDSEYENVEHKIIQGIKRTCMMRIDGAVCSKRTEKFCSLCQLSLCQDHISTHVS